MKDRRQEMCLGNVPLRIKSLSGLIFSRQFIFRKPFILNNNGIGIEASKMLKTKSNGVGLRMNKERIQMMNEKYGGNYSFRLIDLTEQGLEGTLVEIEIPEEN